MHQYFEIWMRRQMQEGKMPLLTALPSLFFSLGVRARHQLYDKGFLRQKKSILPVVSIGNIIAGGAGKTPLVLLLAKSLKQLRVAILSRGYRSSAEKGRLPLCVDLKKHTPQDCGDESFLLANRLHEAIVIAGKDRSAGSKLALEKGAQVILLDDGMQHRRLHRDKEIVVLDGASPFGKGFFMPKGMLREDPKRLEKADLIVVMGKMSHEDEKKLESYTRAPRVRAEIVPKKIMNLNGEEVSLSPGSRVGVFCGIGNPERFLKHIASMGFEVVTFHPLPDHKKIGKKELEEFAILSKQKGAEWLFCTEKDSVKLSQMDVLGTLPIGWVKADLEIVQNQSIWEQTVCEIKQLAGIAL